MQSGVPAAKLTRMTKTQSRIAQSLGGESKSSCLLASNGLEIRVCLANGSETSARNLPLSSISDCSIAIDATYYLYQFLETSPYFEPLLTALGGLTGIETHLSTDLDKFKEHNVIPFFIFDGQPMVCQSDVSLRRGKAANAETERAWDLYFATRAEDAVTAFGINNGIPTQCASKQAGNLHLTTLSIGSFRIQSLYPLLMRLLKERDLHFLVPPFNASAQVRSSPRVRLRRPVFPTYTTP